MPFWRSPQNHISKWNKPSLPNWAALEQGNKQPETAMNYKWHANYQLLPEIAEDCRIFAVVVKITTAFILGLGKSIWFIQMLQLLNIITFICSYLERGVGGDKPWDLGAWIPRNSSGGSPSPLSVADGGGPSHLPSSGERRGQGGQVSTQHLSTFTIYSMAGG